MHYTLLPDKGEFTQRFDRKIPQLVSATIIADLETPVSTLLKLQRAGEPCFLLESVQGGENLGRYSIIGLKPDLLWRCRGNKAEINRRGTLNEADFEAVEENSLAALKSLLRSSRLDIPEHLPPMAAGFIGYMGYDMVKLMEKLPDKNPDAIGLPDAYLMRPRIMIIFDSVKGELHVVTPIWKEHGFASAEVAYEAASKIIGETVQQLRQPLTLPEHRVQMEPLPFASNTTREEYHGMVERAKEYIRAGDIFQVVPSQRFHAPFRLPHFSLYRSLRHLNPSPFLFFLNFGTFSLVGSSPEILVRLRDGAVTIRPIAGTRKRGANKEEDKALAEDLLSDPKEIAEHLMLLDLGRNDVGRIAKTGTVKVTERMVIEHYSHVMHIVSNVEGMVDDKRFDMIDALVAGFPAGTVSGAPKIRAMEIIDELEKERRSFYGGCVGYFSANGSMDTCITLRTALIKDGTIYAQAGGGVVADSDPEAEYQESCNKARAVMSAAQDAWRFA
ncbi:MAG TPA: anthranilate synthase component I [Rickettsiales bacterium]|nr:anthranilate synthase component I [Rickettsiales bacterium]